MPRNMLSIRSAASVEPEALREAELELVLREAPGLQAAQIGQRLGILPKQALDGVLLEALFAAEVGEAVPDRGGQHAAEVDQQAGVLSLAGHRICRHGRRGYRSTEPRGLVRGQRAGRRAPAQLRAHLRRPLEPDLRRQRCRAGSRWALAPASARQAPRLRARHGARAPDHRGAPGHGRAGAAGRRPLRGRLRERRAVLRHGVRGRARSCAREAEAEESFDEAERRAIGERVVDTLVAIHAVDPDQVGLGELGRKQDYVARQLRRWHEQWEKSKTRELPLVDDVHRRLSERIPEQGPATIVHGDYRLDNMILSTPARSRRSSTGSSARSAIRSPTSACCWSTGRRRATSSRRCSRRPPRRPAFPRATRCGSATRALRARPLRDRLLRRARLLEAGDHPPGRLRPLRRRPVRRGRRGLRGVRQDRGAARAERRRRRAPAGLARRRRRTGT